MYSRTVNFEWVEIRQKNFAASGPKFNKFFLPNEKNGSQSSLFPFADILIHFADIRSQNLKLSKIARTVDFGWVHIGQRNFAVNGRKFINFLFNLEGIAVDKTGLRLSISGRFTEIFVVKDESCMKLRRVLDVFCSPKF